MKITQESLITYAIVVLGWIIIWAIKDMLDNSWPWERYNPSCVGWKASLVMWLYVGSGIITLLIYFFNK